MTVVSSQADIRRKATLALLTRAGRRTTDVNPNARSVSVEMAGWWSDQLGVPVPAGTPTADLPRPSNAKAIEEIKSLPLEQRAGYLKLRAAGGTHARVMRDLRGLPVRKATGAKKAAPTKAAKKAPSRTAGITPHEFAARHDEGTRAGLSDADAAKYARSDYDSPRAWKAAHTPAKKAAKAAPAKKATPAKATSATVANPDWVQKAPDAEAFRAMSKDARLRALRDVAETASPTGNPLALMGPRGWAKHVLGELSVDELREMVDELADISNWGTSEKRDKGQLAQAVMNLTGLNADGYVDTATGRTSFNERQAARKATPTKATRPAANPDDPMAREVADYLGTLGADGTDRLSADAEARRYLVEDVKLDRNAWQRLAANLGVEVAPSASIKGTRDAIQRQLVTRRLEHDAYMGQAAPATGRPAKATPPAKAATPRARKATAPTTGQELRDHVTSAYGRHVPATKKTTDDLGRTWRNHREYQDAFARRAEELASVDLSDPAALRAAAEKWREAAERERGVSSMRASQRRGTFHHARGTAGMAAADQYENVADYLDGLAREADAPQAATPRKATPAKKAAPRAAFDAAAFITELRGDWSNPPSREETAAKLKGLPKAHLLAMARKLNVPGVGRMTIDELRTAIVQDTVGRRLDSISTRGFRGERPGEPDSDPITPAPRDGGSIGGDPFTGDSATPRPLGPAVGSADTPRRDFTVGGGTQDALAQAVASAPADLSAYTRNRRAALAAGLSVQDARAFATAAAATPGLTLAEWRANREGGGTTPHKLTAREYDLLVTAQFSADGRLLPTAPATMRRLREAGFVETRNGGDYVTDLGRDAMAGYTPSTFSPLGIAERLAALDPAAKRDAAGIVPVLAGLSVAQLKRVAREFTLHVPDGDPGPGQWNPATQSFIPDSRTSSRRWTAAAMAQYIADGLANAFRNPRFTWR